MSSGADTEVDPWREPAIVRTSGTATLALAAGLASFVCLFGIGGALAIALGWVAHAEIERARGSVTGKGLASAGIALGITNLVVSLVGLGALITLAARPEAASAPPPPALPRPALVATPSAPRSAAGPPAGSETPHLTAADGQALPRQIGSISIVELAPHGAGLEDQLRFQLAESAKAGERLVLWTVKPDCPACEAVGSALPDARMQRALERVRLLRANAEAFGRELERLGVPSEDVPGFTLLDARCRARDHIHSDEWDADVPGNIAPVLAKFVRHALTTRRHPWERPLRQGETSL